MMTSSYKVVSDCQLQNLPEILENHVGFKDDGYFVDVGAYDGLRWSKTWEFSELGWKGLLLEPLPEAFGKCVRNHAGHDALVLPYAVSGENDNQPLYISDIFSTLELHHAPVMNRSGAVLTPDEFVNVRTVTLDWALEYYAWPTDFDLLCVNTYGSERLVLNGFNLAYWRPKVMVWQLMENHPGEELRRIGEGLPEMIQKHGYSKVYADGTNSIFVVND